MQQTEKFKGVGTEPNPKFHHASCNQKRTPSAFTRRTRGRAAAGPHGHTVPDTVVRAHRSGSLVSQVGGTACSSMHAALHAAAMADWPVAHARSGRHDATSEYVPHCWAWGASRSALLPLSRGRTHCPVWTPPYVPLKNHPQRPSRVGIDTDYYRAPRPRRGLMHVSTMSMKHVELAASSCPLTSSMAPLPLNPRRLPRTRRRRLRRGRPRSRARSSGR